MSRTEPSVDLNFCESHVIIKAILANGTILRLGSATLTDVIEPDTLGYAYEAKIVKDSQVRISTTRTADQMSIEAENVDKVLGLTLNDINTVLSGARVVCSKVFTNIPTKVAASGIISFPLVPNNNDTVAINGVVWTFKTSSPTGNQVLINGTSGSAVNLAAALTASKLPKVYMADYVKLTSPINRVVATYKLKGEEGNSFTLAKSGTQITVSGATLTGGGITPKVWDSKVLLTGEISYAEANPETMTIKIVSDTAPNVAFISNRPVQTHCPLIFKGFACGYTGSLTTCNKVYESVDGCSGRENQERFGGAVVKGELPQIIPGDIDTDVFDIDRRGWGHRYFPDPDDGRVRILY